jgi:endoribonuclease Dicer
MKTKPDMWSVGGIPDMLFVTVLNLATPEALGRTSQPLALLTRNPLPQLPSFELHFGGGNHSPVQCTPINHPIEVSATTLDMVNTFTLCLFDHVFSKQYESNPSKMPYFLVPAFSGQVVNGDSDPLSVISWDILQSVQEHQLKWAENPWDNKFWQTESDEFFVDKYIIDPFDGSRKLWSKGVTREYKALDPVPPNTAPRSGARKDNSNILEYSCSLWAKARSRRVFDPTQRVVEAEYISLRRNLLDEFDEPEDANPKKCFVVLEPLQISPVSENQVMPLQY